MTTGYAFVVRELVARNGLAETDVTYVRAGGTANRYRELIAGKQEATLLRTPFELLAQESRLQSARQSPMRSAPTKARSASRGAPGPRANEAALIGFHPRLPRGADWLYDRGNREIVEALLVANIRDMTPALAKQSYDLLLADKGGLTRDLALDIAGIAHGAALAQQVRRAAEDADRPDEIRRSVLLRKSVRQALKSQRRVHDGAEKETDRAEDRPA